jgi:hypothetical protein
MSDTTPTVCGVKLDGATITAIINAAFALEPTVAKLIQLIIDKCQGKPVDEVAEKQAMAEANAGLATALANWDAAAKEARTEAEANLAIE